LLVSLVFHVVIIGLLAWFAAREGMLGQPLKQITVRLLPPPVEEKPPAPEPPRPPPPQEKPTALSEPAPLKVSAPMPAPISAPVPAPVAPVAAPAPAEMPALTFDDGGKTVQTEKDPMALYRSFVEFSLRSRWDRPTDMADERYVAEVEVAVDAAGRISDPRWKRESGNARWDASVMEAITQARKLDRSPPAGFPVRLTVRFDVIQSAELNIP
jgi:TonB family protein